jgi:hypothetical protein
MTGNNDAAASMKKMPISVRLGAIGAGKGMRTGAR